MIISIIGCGQSAKDWHKTPCDLSIGVNDCLKFGHQTDWLVVVNAVNKFTPKPKNGYQDRLFTITRSRPKRFFCHNGAWKQYFTNAELLQLYPFRGTVKKGKIYFSKTSPFVAMNLAYEAGATDIILWGVDFLDHPNVKDKILKSELMEYKRLFDALEGKGVRCWIGSPETVLNDQLMVWKNT